MNDNITVTLTEEQVGDIISWLDYVIDGICGDEKNDAQVERLQAICNLLLNALKGAGK
jgi:hypothetical protein